MGVVYRAEDQNLRRTVAVKVLPPELVGDEERRLRFLREARAAAAVTHPNIATVHEIGEADGTVFIAMEHIEGKTLRSVISARPLPIKDAVLIAAQIAEGLAAAHQAGVIHRDLKPDNIMLTPDQHVKILDFGLAKMLDEHQVAKDAADSRVETISGEMTRAGKLMGTAAYMSPEQARGDKIDARSDLFAFGIVLYEMVTGVAPFKGRSATDVLSAIIRDQPVPALQINAGVPAELQRVIDKCLEKDRAERYQHADDVAVDLRRMKRTTDSGTVAIRTPKAVEDVSLVPERGSLLRGRRVLFAGSVVALAILAAAGSMVWQRYRTSGGFNYHESIIITDFENATGRPEFDTTIRDAFEDRMAQSTFLDVISGERLKQLVMTQTGASASKINLALAEGLCGKGACSGYLSGQIGPAGSGYRIEADLYKVGSGRPTLVRLRNAADEHDILNVIHDVVLDMRRAVGESPESMVETTPPTTRSLAAFQAYTRGNSVGSPAESATLFKQAVEIDPDFVDAWTALADAAYSHGELQEYRRAAERAYRLSPGQPDLVRLGSEITYLDSMHDYDTELDRLNAMQHRYPRLQWIPGNIGFLYLYVYEDPVQAEPFLREGFRMTVGMADLDNLTLCLAAEGRADEIEAVVSEFRRSGGPANDVTYLLMRVFVVRGDWKKVDEMARSLAREPGLIRTEASIARLQSLLAAGRLGEAFKEASVLWRVSVDEHEGWIELRAALDKAWLESRRGGVPKPLPPEVIALEENNNVGFVRFVAACVDIRLEKPLADAIHAFELGNKGVKNRFVREELQFGHGCLALVRGEVDKARSLLEPLAQDSSLAQRHRYLGRTFEALGLWAKAAGEYEITLRTPDHKWMRLENPSIWVLDEFRLAEIYERLRDQSRARQWYERFLTDWKDADPDIPEIAEARKRLAVLGSIKVPSG